MGLVVSQITEHAVRDGYKIDWTSLSSVAADVSDGEPRAETLAVRFGNTESR